MADVPDPATGPVTAPERKGKRTRINRWDRPREPHDWRWVVGHIGRALITVGLLMFGFVAYQLWGTGLQTARAQNELESEFDQFIEDSGISPDTLAPATVTATPTTTIPTTTTVAATIESTATTEPAVETTSTSPPTTIPPITAAPPVLQDYGNVDPGDGLFQIKIPRIDIDYTVVAGVTADDLAKGPGHFPDTNLPGQFGNSAVAGHRTGHGGPFFDLDKLSPGDEIQISTRLGDAYAYIVTDSVIVGPSDYQVVTDSDPSLATLTLVTCTPKYTSSKRLVVHSTLDPSRGSPVGAPLIFYGQNEPVPVESVLPAEDTVAAVTTEQVATVPDTGGPGTTGPDSTIAEVVDTSGPDSAVPGSVAPATQPTSTTLTTISTDAVAATSEFAGEDAFSQGWFDDGRAWPHVAGWATLLALTAYGAYRVAKRFRRLYLAFLVGFVPFVVALYFFYVNVNRLLPAAI